MSDAVITIENLGKKYRIRHDHAAVQRYVALRDVIAEKFTGLFQNRKSEVKNQKSVEDFWALKDISFEVPRGEVIGIIGRNGAGKTTLLKILSRITEPTEGRVRIKGRVASLLEVGMGFHPELTGRENISLNGAILGMTRAEIKKKFDEIVAFAEVEKFLDTPVKRYSSGMYVRLAFAVAAHLDPDILIVDEVLAVGDAEFQKKCLGKMGEVVNREGRTVLFVSHNMTTIANFCGLGILLNEGKLLCHDSADTTVAAYLNSISGIAAAENTRFSYRQKSDLLSIESVGLLVNGKPSTVVQAGDPCSFRIKYKCSRKDLQKAKLSVSIMLYADGRKIANLWTNYNLSGVISLQPQGLIECVIPKWPFRNRSFYIDLYTHIGNHTEEWLERCLSFESSDGNYYGSGVITNPDQGLLFLEHSWESYAI